MKRIIGLLTVVMLLSLHSFGQERQIKGKVTSKGEPLPFVNVSVKGTTLGTSTDLQGNYELAVPASATTLEFSLIGYKTKDLSIENSTSYDVDMEEDVLKLNEVVVTAIGIKKEKKALGYAVTEVNVNDVQHSGEPNIVEGLAGKVAGVQVTGSAGVAGASSNILIRGIKSIEGDNSPLFVVDGMPIDNSQLSSGNPDNAGSNGDNNLLESVANSNRGIDLNPDDIESMTVLKGAAATALYGLSAANGAIIITTKKGHPGAGKGLNISYNTTLGFDVVDKLPELQDQWGQGSGGQYLGPESHWRTSWGPRIDTMRYRPDPSYVWDKNGVIVSQHDSGAGKAVTPYDNVGKFFRTGVTTNHTLSLSGGSDRTNYYFSIGEMHQTGIVPNNEFNRLSFKLNSDTKISEWMSVASSANYINSGGTRIEGGGSISGVMLGLLRTPITFDNSNGLSDPVTDKSSYELADGTQRNFRGGIAYDNPYWTVNQNPLIDDVNRFIGNTSLTFTPLKWLTVVYRPGIDFYSDRRKQHFAIGSGQNPGGRIFEDHNFVKNFNADLLAIIDKDLTKALNLNLTLGNNMNSSYSQRLFTEGDNLTIPDFYNMNNAQSTLIRESVGKARGAAFYGDARLGYKSFLYLDLTGREEWSTMLPENHNSFFFPSASLSFIFTDALGMQNNKILPYGKINASIAQVGNVPPFLYATDNYYSTPNIGDGWTQSNGIKFPFQGIPGYNINNTLGNPLLKPEQTSSIEIGTDLKFYQNRGGLTLNYYQSKSKDQIFSVPIAASTGYVAAVLNAGSLQNKGIEIELYVSPVKNKNFEWTISGNFARNKNTVVQLYPGVTNLGIGGYQGAIISAIPGMPFGQIYGVGWVRDGNGNIVIQDTGAGKGYPILDTKNKGLGSVFPDWTAGIRNTLTYKGWSLSGLIDIRHGGKIWNGTRGILDYFGRAKETENRNTPYTFSGVYGHLDDNGNVVLTDGTGKVSKTEVNNAAQVLRDENWYSGNGGGFSPNTEDFVENGGWVRLRDLTLSYTFKPEKLKKSVFTAVEISFTARNLWLHTKYTGVDPETSLTGANTAQGLDYFNMPGTKSYIIGLKVSL